MKSLATNDETYKQRIGVGKAPAFQFFHGVKVSAPLFGGFPFVETLPAGLPGKPQKTLFIWLITFCGSLDDPFVDLKIIFVEGGVLFYDLSECFIQVNLCVFVHCITPFLCP